MSIGRSSRSLKSMFIIWLFHSSFISLLTVQEVSCANNLILPPLHLQLEPEAKDIYWHAGDAHICVLVSTDLSQGLKLTALLASLLSSEFPYLDIFLIDSHTSQNSLPWMKRMRAIFNSRGEAGDTARPQVHISPRTRNSVSKLHPGLVEEDFGYLLLDYVIADLRDGRYPHAPHCDYFMTTQGQNLYNVRLIPETLPFMRDKYDLIGINFSSRYKMNNPLVKSKTEPNQQVKASFQTGAIDRGAVFFRSNSTENMTFALRFLNPDGTHFNRTAGSLDGNFIEDLARTPGMKSKLVPQLLFIQQ